MNKELELRERRANLLDEVNKIDRELAALKRQESDTVRHGHWVEDIEYDELFELGQAYCTCSECGRRQIGDKKFYDKKYKYCNNCGAKMDGD